MRAIDADALEKEGWSLHRTIRVDMNTDEYQTKPLKQIPTIESECKWIPCSERLPKTNGIYIVTRNISDGFECANITDACYFDGSGTWHDDTRINHSREYLTDVIAWMPLPEPYKDEGMRLIDANTFKTYMRNALEETRNCYPDGGKWAATITEEFCKDIDEQPTIEEHKKGWWILHENQRQEDVDNGNYLYICSECGKSDLHAKTQKVPFCWWCGAQMEVKDENN